MKVALLTLCIGASSLFLAQTAQTATASKPMIVAHRGSSAQAPENTLPAFQLAWEQGVDTIITDLPAEMRAALSTSTTHE